MVSFLPYLLPCYRSYWLSPPPISSRPNTRSNCVLGVLDSELRPELTVDEALALGRRAILAAAHRDAFSGGSINCIAPLSYPSPIPFSCW